VDNRSNLVDISTRRRDVMGRDGTQRDASDSTRRPTLGRVPPAQARPIAQRGITEEELFRGYGLTRGPGSPVGRPGSLYLGRPAPGEELVELSLRVRADHAYAIALFAAYISEEQA